MDRLHNIYIKTLVIVLLILTLNITICYAQDDDLCKFENYLLSQGLDKINNDNISFDLKFKERNNFGLNGSINSIFRIYHVNNSYILVQNNLSLVNSRLNNAQANGIIYRYTVNNHLYGINYFSDIDTTIVRNSLGFEYADGTTDAYINIYNSDTVGYTNGYDYTIKKTINSWIDIKYVNSNLDKKSHNITMNFQITDRFRVDVKTDYIGFNYDIYNTSKTSLEHRSKKEKQVNVDKQVARK